ncbi:MAG: hypothetical protein JWP22_4000 [Ramlibacter sp.]|nr:hypothetical protein [Ramlibacter sp.]MDB5915325.1 hypothetical protein [Ramlibacter sp.]
MASYFVACDAQSDGAHAVHDRNLCPPSCFPPDATNEYLGEFTEMAQAVAVARLRFRPARRCRETQGTVALRSKAPPPLLPALTPPRP